MSACNTHDPLTITNYVELIMAIRDHTVRIRSSVPPDDTLTPPPRDPSCTAAALPETLRHAARGDIALAVLALTRLRVDSEQCRHAQARGFPGHGQPYAYDSKCSCVHASGAFGALRASQLKMRCPTTLLSNLNVSQSLFVPVTRIR